MGKQNHPPFSEWLLSGDTLTPEQRTKLQVHLRTCLECSQVQASLIEVDSLFHAAGMSAPVIGFADRWQFRLQDRNLRMERRRAWFMFFFATAMAVFVLSFLTWRTVGVLNSPAAFLSSMVYLWTSILVFTQRFQASLWTFAKLLPTFSMMGLIFFVGFSSLMSVLWVIAFRKLTSERSVAK